MHPSQTTDPDAGTHPGASSAPVIEDVTEFPAGGQAIKANLTCPHCWEKFATGDTLWIARHEDLRGDALLGPEAMRRFLPTRFNVNGEALDARGHACHGLACPRCHLPIARGLLSANQLYFSLVGVPSSGKSYFTAALTWRLREALPRFFGATFSDLDPDANRELIENERTLFFSEAGAHTEPGTEPNAEPGMPAAQRVSLEKTQMQGRHYDPIRRDGQTVRLAHPFQFMLTRAGVPPRVLNLYDNAGEHFLPGADTTLNPGTRHLARANALMFLFDPLQDTRLRDAIVGGSNDPQLTERVTTARQDTVLNEACARLRRYARLSDTEPLEHPLLVLVGKADTWIDLIDGVTLDDEPLTRDAAGRVVVDTARVEDVSRRVRAWLQRLTPEFVALAEGFHRHVVYMPTSALGGSPLLDTAGDALVVEAGRLRPRWVAAPVLYALARWSRDGLSPEEAPAALQPSEAPRADGR